MNAQQSKRTRSQANEFRPRLEHLEDRLCLDCKFFLSGMDTLTITDGKRASNNVIDIEDDGTDGKGNIKVTCDGVTHPDAHSDTRLARKLKNGNYLVCHEADGAIRDAS